MKLSTRFRYGCRAMVDLAMHDDREAIALEVLATEQRIPERYLAKIIQDLRRSGLIRSVRGAHGGYVLSRPASDITLLDVWEALEGPVSPVDCLERPGECLMADECVTREVWEKLRQAMQDVLSAETLAGLVRRHAANVAARQG